MEWPRGEATACKAVYTGSNPVSTSQQAARPYDQVMRTQARPRTCSAVRLAHLPDTEGVPSSNLGRCTHTQDGRPNGSAVLCVLARGPDLGGGRNAPDGSGQVHSHTNRLATTLLWRRFRSTLFACQRLTPGEPPFQTMQQDSQTSQLRSRSTRSRLREQFPHGLRVTFCVTAPQCGVLAGTG